MQNVYLPRISRCLNDDEWVDVKVLLTGANGFLASYVIPQLLAQGFSVVGLDDDSKYGYRTPPQYGDYQHVTGSASDPTTIGALVDDADYVIANAASVGGVEFLDSQDGEIGITNSMATARTLEAAIGAHRRNGRLRRYVAVSSSMVFDRVDRWPTMEGQELEIAPPRLTYGMEKRAMEAYVRAAGTRLGLPYTIVRPFNCIGVGETRALGATARKSGDVSLVMSHVVPDLIHKVLLGQSPLRLLGTGHQRRHFTAADDVARGLIAAMTSAAGAGEDFNLATPESHSVREVAQLIWDRMKPGEALRFASDRPVDGDVVQRAPSTEKAQSLLGFRATIPLTSVLDESIPWVTTAFKEGKL